MIYYTGKGIRILYVFIATIIIMYFINMEIGFPISFIVSGIYGIYFGKKWNGKNPKKIDTDYGEMPANHSISGIKIENLGLIMFILGTIIILQKTFSIF